MSVHKRGLLDTSIFIATETGRSLKARSIPAESAISVVTFAELQAGVLAARDVDSRAARLATLDTTADMAILPIDVDVAAAWARLRVHLLEANRRLNVNDSWIAATAIVHRIPVVTQDGDFDPLDGVAGLQIVKV
ncbi:MAG TPA: type II toxin-antitoxin system VapC family toxin [Jatrophihabitantaceae bacterium]